MGYLFLILTILSETAAITFMKLSHGFIHKGYAALAVFFYTCGFFLLTLALKYLPVGLANAIWAGSSTVLVVLIGLFYFKESLGFAQIIFLIMIIIGLIGLQYTQKTI